MIEPQICQIEDSKLPLTAYEACNTTVYGIGAAWWAGILRVKVPLSEAAIGVCGHKVIHIPECTWKQIASHLFKFIKNKLKIE